MVGQRLGRNLFDAFGRPSAASGRFSGLSATGACAPGAGSAAAREARLLARVLRARRAAGRPGAARRREPAGMVRRGPRDHDRGRDHGPGLHHQHGRRPRLSARSTASARGVVSPARAGQALLPAVAEAPARFAGHRMDGLDGCGRAPVPTLAWQEALAEGEQAPAVDHGRNRLVPDDTACFIYTSGTGGRPKGVMLTHGNILANLRGAWRLLERRPRRRGLPVLPAAVALPTSTRPASSCRSRWAARSTMPRASSSLSAQPDRGAADDHDLRAAALRGDAAADRRTASTRQGGSKARLFHGRGRARPPARYQNGGRLGSHARLPIALLDRLVRAQGPRALRRPAQGDGLGRRAARPGGRACSSRRSACRCSRATARPRRRRWSASTRRAGPAADGRAAAGRASRCGSPRTARSWSAAIWS